MLSRLHAVALAQGTTADIVGRVTDTSGGVLPGATVTVEHTAAGDLRTRVDGMDDNERAIGTVGIKPSIDAIAEVRVQTRQMQFATKLIF